MYPSDDFDVKYIEKMIMNVLKIVYHNDGFMLKLFSALTMASVRNQYIFPNISWVNEALDNVSPYIMAGKILAIIYADIIPIMTTNAEEKTFL
ncbi:hypothetical protein D3C76_1453490 [compost metagenome]